MSKTMLMLGMAALAALPMTSWAQAVPVDAASEAAPSDEVLEDTPPPQGEAPEASAESMESTESAESSGEGEVITPDSVSADEGVSEGGEEDAPVIGEDGFRYYVGVERAEVTLDLSDEDLATRFGSDELDGAFYQARAGVRLFPGISVEAQYGFAADDDDDAGSFEAGEYYAAYLVPTGTVLDLFELSARVGFAVLGAERPGVDEKFEGVSYGLNIEFPIRVISESLPDIRITTGGTVYHQDKDTRAYGFQYGLRYDFSI